MCFSLTKVSFLLGGEAAECYCYDSRFYAFYLSMSELIFGFGLVWSVCVDFISCVQLTYEILVHALLDAQHGVRLIWLVGNALDLPLC